MSYVVNFTDWTPGARYDGEPWTEIRIYEAADETGPFTTPIETIALDPVDADPAHPQSRDFTTDQAALTQGWYLVEFVDADGGAERTVPIFNTTATGLVYAQVADLEDYIPGGTSLTAAEAAELLARAERDVDWGCGGGIPTDTTGLLYDPASLTAAQTAALKRATCAQAEYRITMGPRFFVTAQFESVKGPDFEQRGQLPYVGPKVYRELAGTGLDRRFGLTIN